MLAVCLLECVAEVVQLFDTAVTTPDAAQTQLTTPEDDDASPTAMDLGSTAKPTSNTANNNSDDQHTTTNTDNTANIADEDMLLSVQQQRTRAAIEQALGYRFKDPRLLFRALTHPSCHATGGSYQRLEYVGDAVLDLMIMHRACAQFLYVECNV